MRAVRLAWMGEDAVAVATAARVAALRVGPDDGWTLRRHHIEVVHVRGDLDLLRRAAVATTLGGVLAVVATPIGPPARLPWWGRRFQRFVFASQVEAKAWLPHVALGRLVVVEPEPAERFAEGLGAVYAEVASMGRRSRRVRRSAP